MGVYKKKIKKKMIWVPRILCCFGAHSFFFFFFLIFLFYKKLKLSLKNSGKSTQLTSYKIPYAHRSIITPNSIPNSRSGSFCKLMGHHV
jgi:hypothetical protein